MKLLTLLLTGTLTAGCLQSFASAQETRPDAGQHPDVSLQRAQEDNPHYFKLVFTLRELQGKTTLNLRNFSTVVRTGYQYLDNAKIRSGNRLTVLRMDKGQEQSITQDFGVNIDCEQVALENHEFSGKLAVQVSSVPETKADADNPLVRNLAWESRVLVPLDKATAIYSSDDTNSNHTFELSITPTLLH